VSRPKSPETQKLRERAVELLVSGRTQLEVAKILGRNLRTVQKWLSLPEFKDALEAKKQQRKALIQSDPVVLSVVEIRQQVEQILAYSESQKTFATEMGEVVFKSVRLLKAAVERLENNPDELTVRNIPAFIRAVCVASQTVSVAWSDASGLESLLEQVRADEPKAIKIGEKET
jgi:hypothetical protein